MSAAPRVWITGVGLHGAHGDGPATLLAVRERRSAVVLHRTPEADGFPAVAAAPAAAASLDDLVPDRKLQKYMSRAAWLAVLAAGRALRHAGLLGDAGRCAGLALFAATGHIGFDLSQVTQAIAASGARQAALDGERMAAGLARCHPLLPFRMLLNMPLGLVSIAFGIRGENAILYPGALQGGRALCMAHHALVSGRCRRALAGAAANGLALMPVATAWRAGRLAATPEAALHRSPAERGVPATDAGAFLVLESDEAVRERGARPIAELVRVEAGAAGEAQERVRAAADAGRPAPALVLTAGALDGAADAEDERLAREARAPGGAPVRLDPLLGHAGAAAPATAVGLAALALAAGTAGPALVAVRDLEEDGLCTAALAPAEARG